MAITTAQYSIGSTATQIVANDIGAEEVHIHCSAGSCYIGDSTVTTSTGLKVDNGDKLTFTTHIGAVFAIAQTSATLSVAVIDK